jgi:hypothetical protein
MFNLSAAVGDVTTDRRGRPRQIRQDGERLLVTAFESVRNETSAYPIETGPRTVFVVRAAGRRYRLVHLARDRRWTVEPLAAREPRLAPAA